MQCFVDKIYGKGKVTIWPCTLDRHRYSSTQIASLALQQGNVHYATLYPEANALKYPVWKWTLQIPVDVILIQIIM